MQDVTTFLTQKKEELERRLYKLSKHSGELLDPDSRERVSEIQNDQVMQVLDDEAREELAAIDLALKKIASNTYNLCTGCQETIPEKRLEANPLSLFCISCAEKRLLSS